MATRKYDDAFKEEVIRKSMEPGRSVADVAQEYGISAHTLYRWRNKPPGSDGKLDWDPPVRKGDMTNFNALVKEMQETDPEVLQSLWTTLKKMLSSDQGPSHRKKG